MAACCNAIAGDELQRPTDNWARQGDATLHYTMKIPHCSFPSHSTVSINTAASRTLQCSGWLAATSSLQTAHISGFLPQKNTRTSQARRHLSGRAQTRQCAVDHSPISIALASSFFHRSATSLARGSSGFGALRRAWMDRRTVLICRAGLHLSAVPGVGKEGREGRGGAGRRGEEGGGHQYSTSHSLNPSMRSRRRRFIQNGHTT